ncbi:MAG: aromatic ring-hydroxylating dioxygenase subunit alpha [Chromatiales bacterium]|nr:MAG: aromatic ring-hydroxylating dioxygenase subunit alpha [Chromatiales bacterium]
MTPLSGHWYAVLSSRELGSAPVAKERFGQRLVFWRDTDGHPACLLDLCPHRGAALSLGEVVNGAIACPYHGFQFAPDGRCLRVPAEGEDWTIPDQFSARAMPVRESQAFIWLWRGPAVPHDALPAVPRQPGVGDLVHEECVQRWPAHYTRCMEGVLDHSHLPFVHRKTLGRRMQDPTTRIRVDDTEGGFRANLLQADGVRHHVDCTYPNIWTQLLVDGYAMSATFAPVDDSHTKVYCRVHHRFDWALLRPLMRLWCRVSNWLVFHEDQAVLDSQRPRSADDAAHEKLVPSDAAVLAFRKLRAKHRAELSAQPGVVKV